MPDEKDPWPADLRKQWDATWSMPHMQAGLDEIKRRLRPGPIPLVPGYDALVLAAGEHHSAVGQQKVFNAIDEMRKDKIERRELPPPFTPEALRTEPLLPQHP